MAHSARQINNSRASSQGYVIGFNVTSSRRLQANLKTGFKVRFFEGAGPLKIKMIIGKIWMPHVFNHPLRHSFFGGMTTGY